MQLFKINILIYYVFYMFRSRGFIFRKKVLYTVIVYCVSHASISNTLFHLQDYLFTHLPHLYIHTLYHTSIYTYCTTPLYTHTVPHLYIHTLYHTSIYTHCTTPLYTHTVPHLYIHTLYHTSIYNCLPEDEPSVSKHVEDIKN